MSCPSFCHEEGCTLSYAQHLSFAIGGDAKVTTGTSAASTRAMEKAWAQDLPAYKRLRADGFRPKATEGAALLEKTAQCEEHITTGMTHVAPRSFERFESEFGHKVTEAAA